MKPNPLSRLLLAVAATAALASAASAAPHGILWAQGARPTPMGQTAAGSVKYYGGPVISHAKVTAVFWGASVDAETQSNIGPFYQNMLDSTYMDWLSEYATNIAAVDGRQGTDQTIGRGSYQGAVTITPANTSASLTDEMIQKELDEQIAAGKLPAADNDTLYMIYFPAGVSISIGSQASCQTFCAYHEGFKSARSGANVYYGVMPVCGFGCGMGGSTFDSLSIVSSHECIEAVTDPFPTPGDSPAFPQAWNDAKGQEVGDLCTSGSAAITGHGITSQVQYEWSNVLGGCAQGPWSQNAPSFAESSRATPAFPMLESFSAAPASVFAGR